MAPQDGSSARFARLIPALGWLPRYERRWLRPDVTAGIAVTALVVPKNLGYAGIAGVPVQNGLYAAAAGAIIYALFCTSRHISTGPSSSLAAVAGGAVLATGLGGSDAAQLVAAIAIATGVLFLLFAVFRLGWIARFLSKAVVTGFLAGAAVDVVIGAVLSLGWLVYVATRPPMPLLGREAGTQVFRELDEHPGDETYPGIAVLRFDGALFFATAEALEDRVRGLDEDGGLPRALVLDLEGVNFVDSQGSAKLEEIHQLAEADGITLRLARVKPQVLGMLQADGIVDLIGADRIHGNVYRAVDAQLHDDAGNGPQTSA